MSTEDDKLRILIVDDSELDAELMIRALRGLPASHGVQVKRVADEGNMRTALVTYAPHAILCDFTMPGFNGLAALAVAQDAMPNVPFIFVSGSIGEETAVEALRAGAFDYVLKDRLARLPSAVLRALEFARLNAERERTQERLRRTHAFETIGQLTGGLAHDFNNLLTVISGSLELALGSLGHGSAAGRDLQVARDAARRATELTQSLLAVARGRARLRSVIAADLRIEDLLPLLRNSAGPITVVNFAPGAGTATFRADSAEFDTALLNLVINARDAMPHGGVVRIITRATELAAPRRIAGSTLGAGRYVTIEVVDGGTGMTSDVLAAAFEPLFTTKTGDRGTGLGLPMVRAVCLRSGGTTEIESAVGLGTTVRMWLRTNGLPATASAPSADASIRAADSVARILVVDDEPALRRIVCRWLVQSGHEVSEAGSVGEARALLDRDDRYDLMICDLLLPDGDGTSLAVDARAASPWLAVLFVSGLDSTPAEPLQAGFLRKPFDSRALLAAVAETLTAARAAAAARQ